MGVNKGRKGLVRVLSGLARVIGRLARVLRGLAIAVRGKEGKCSSIRSCGI